MTNAGFRFWLQQFRFESQYHGMAGATFSWSVDLLDIEEINQDNYYQKIAEADAPVVLVDFYTQWYDVNTALISSTMLSID